MRAALPHVLSLYALSHHLAEKSGFYRVYRRAQATSGFETRDPVVIKSRAPAGNYLSKTTLYMREGWMDGVSDDTIG